MPNGYVYKARTCAEAVPMRSVLRSRSKRYEAPASTPAAKMAPSSGPATAVVPREQAAPKIYTCQRGRENTEDEIFTKKSAC